MIKGLYVHVPFCSHICGYCDFARSRYDQKRAQEYLGHLKRELDGIGQDSFESIYIGGGTPTALSSEQLEELLDILSRFRVTKEYTIEINPETFDLQKGLLLRKYGLNRASIGIQSFDERLLDHMGRHHRNDDVIRTFEILDQVGIKNRSIDLMYGFNIQTVESLASDLEKAVSLDITHVSIYDLEVHPKTLMGRKNYRHVDDETDYLMYRKIVDYLNSHGFVQYETSNFALEGCQSYHNRLYWLYEDFYGAGLSAAGKIGNIRYENTAEMKKYCQDEYRGETLTLTDDDIIFEALMMNLRLLEGIDIEKFDQRFKTDLLARYASAVERNIGKGLLQLSGGHLKVTDQGLFVLNDILVDFME